MKAMNGSPTKISQQHSVDEQYNCHGRMTECQRSQVYVQPIDLKNVVFMRHGKIAISYRKGDLYFVVHKLLDVIRQLRVKYNLLKANTVGRAIAQSMKKVKKELRKHGNSDSDYANLNYRQFMRALLHEIDPPLAKEDRKIKVEELPSEIDVIYHSSALRSIQSAKYIQRHIANGNKEPRIDSSLSKELDEVRFSKGILSKREFRHNGGLEGVRPIVLRKWYCGINKVETLQDSISRIEKLCDFITRSSDKNIIIVTHGWYLRLLYMYFTNQEKSLENLESKKCFFDYGEFFSVQIPQDFSPHISFLNAKHTDPQLESLADPVRDHSKFLH